MAVGKALGIQPSRAVFDNLIEFSFVRKEVVTRLSDQPVSHPVSDSPNVRKEESSEIDRYRIHDLLRRVFFEQADDLVREADVALEQYYRECAAAGDRKAIAEAIYHANRLDWERGSSEWVMLFGEALRQSNFELCRALLDFKTELIIDTEMVRALISHMEGDYLAELAHYYAARQIFSDAIADYDLALQRAPDQLFILNSKGIALATAKQKRSLFGG